MTMKELDKVQVYKRDSNQPLKQWNKKKKVRPNFRQVLFPAVTPAWFPLVILYLSIFSLSCLPV